MGVTMGQGCVEHGRRRMSNDALRLAHAAVERGEWQQALELVAAIEAAESMAEVWEIRAHARYGAADFDGCLAAWEALYELRLAEGDELEAARAAVMLAMFLLIDTGLMASVRGWLRRAERLLASDPDTPAHALVATVRSYERFLCGDTSAARQWSATAIELGTRFDVLPAVVIGRTCAARLTILEGRVDDGLDQLDEVASMLMSGEVDALTAGMMYCELICAARGLALNERAIEWTDVMERWRHDAAFGGVHGRCRVHRAEMLRVSGPCDRAEEEAMLACDELRPWMRREFGWPLVELGNIRLRKGDLDGADEAFTAAHERMWSAQPGLALLRLAEGDVQTAAALIADELAHPFEMPWKERPPIGDLRLAPLLAAQAEIAAAAGDTATARRAADELQRIASTFPSPSLHADALLAAARVALLQGDLHAAKTAATGAAAIWAEVGAPYEAAIARTVLADARQQDGNAEGSLLEWRAARAAFDQFGAHGWVDRCDAHIVLVAREAPQTAQATDAAFRLDGEIRTISIGGITTSISDMKGLRHIARLLSEPGREFHVLDMVAVEQGTAGRAPEDAAVDDDGSLGAAGMVVLDDQARAAYRRRLLEVEDDIDDAVRSNDPLRRELAERDREFLVAELQRAVGLGGRPRATGGNAERARTTVTRSIRYALGRLEELHPVAAAHLDRHVRTGTYCSYAPDPLNPIRWQL